MTNFYLTHDEQNRVTIPNTGIPTDQNGNGQYKSHTMSYLYIREELEKDSPTDKIGLELTINKH